MNLTKLILYRLATTVGFLLLAPVTFAQTPDWIWLAAPNGQPSQANAGWFRKSFQLDKKVVRADLIASGDDAVTLSINGRVVAASTTWNRPARANVAAALRIGDNLITADVKNSGGVGGLVLKLDLTFDDQTTRTLISDLTWQVSPQANAVETDWIRPITLGKLGVAPWGDVFTPPTATLASELETLPGFKIELLRSALPDESSWISMTIDPKGRFIVSPQDGGIYRFTIPTNGSEVRIERITQQIKTAMGMLHAFGALYISGNGPQGLGLYRLIDEDGDDRYETGQMLRKFEDGAGEHGSHALVRGPDNKVYYIHGNFVNVPPDVSPESPHKNYADDQLLPRAEDGNGFGIGRKPPGGFLLRMDKESQIVELFAAGLRNTYDFAVNADGEMFCFDSDMEWDWGMPWYRPTRIYHLVSGGDYGFREGSAKWPAWYQDGVPPVLDMGIGSPTGVKFGQGAKFPVRYQKALYVMDWTYGRIRAVHLTPDGASYKATEENFVVGRGLKTPGGKTPLNVTDMEIGLDGALYFITGGRNTQSGLYRVSYTGAENTAPANVNDAAGAEARALRHQLEAFHGQRNPAAIDVAWPQLNSEDRALRYSARIAVEAQEVALWKDRALKESSTYGGLTALMALARVGPKDTQRDLLMALAKWPLDGLTEDQKLLKLRVIELSFIRQGRPEADLIKLAVEKLDRQYPYASEALNRELCQLLVYLEAPGVVKKTLDLLAKAQTQEEQITYIFLLRNLKTGWTMDDRKAYFGWFNRPVETEAAAPTYPGGAGYTIVKNARHSDAANQWFRDVGREFGNGSSFDKYIANIRKSAVESLSDNERGELASIILGQPATAPRQPVTQRQFVKDWKMADLLPSLDAVTRGRSFTRGKQAFNDAQCLVCHRFGNEGGAVGPELTAAASKYTRQILLESILEPSKVVSEQYQNTTIYLKNGDDITGRVLEENDQKVVLLTNPLANTKAEAKKSEIKSREAAKLSPMPEGLVSILTKDEILDLLAYLESGGNPQSTAFAK